MRVLIVEDSDAICRMIEALVTPRGYEVRAASTGAKALEESITWTPDVVLLDIDLPSTYDGVQVCEKLRAAEGTRDVPVVIISASSDDEVKRRAHEAGATAFYEKPFSPLALLKEIEGLGKRARG